MKVWSKRQRDLGRAPNRVACRLHAVPCELGDIAGEISAARAAKLLDELRPGCAVMAARHDLNLQLVEDLRRIDERMRDTKERITAAPVEPK
jgi:hypothetical protein